jgi:DNA-binding winged helix-turn-helix (wHTH) protein
MNGDLRVGTWLVQPGLNTISQNGTSRQLEPKVMEVLVCLAHHPGETLPKEQLLKTVWPDTFVSLRRIRARKTNSCTTSTSPLRSITRKICAKK